MFVTSNNHLLVGSINLDHVKRRTGCYAQALALTNGEVMNAAVLADYFPAGGHQFACSIGQGFATLGKVGIDETLIVTAWDEADFLGVRLFGQSKALLACQLANLRLGHSAQGK